MSDPNPQASPEALDIPKLNPLQRNIPTPPFIVPQVDSASVEVYNELNEPRARKIQIQNRSDAVLYVTYNSDCSPTVNHDVLAAGVAVGDGLGGIGTYDVREMGIRSISVYSSNLEASVNKWQYNQMPSLI